MATVQKLLTPEEIAARAAPRIPFLRLPARSEAFSLRAQRLRELAPGHSMQGYLELIARVADAQQHVLDDMPPVRLPQPAAVERAREHGMPLLDPRTHVRDPLWADVLRRMLRIVAEGDDAPAVQVPAR